MRSESHPVREKGFKEFKELAIKEYASVVGAGSARDAEGVCADVIMLWHAYAATLELRILRRFAWSCG
jgi:hypothetical protein